MTDLDCQIAGLPGLPAGQMIAGLPDCKPGKPKPANNQQTSQKNHNQHHHSPQN